MPRYEDRALLLAGASEEIWKKGNACEKKYSVKCTGATKPEPQPCKDGFVIVVVVDYCRPPQCHATLNLSQDAFFFIVNFTAGRVKIESPSTIYFILFLYIYKYICE